MGHFGQQVGPAGSSRDRGKLEMRTWSRLASHRVLQGADLSPVESLEDRNAKLSRDKEALTAKQKGFEEKLDCNNQETQTLRDENKQLKAEISQALFDHRNRTQVRAGTASGSNARMELEHEIHMLRLEKNQMYALSLWCFLKC